MGEDDEFTPEQIQEMALMLDPANHVRSFCHDVLDGGVCRPHAITYGVAAGLAEFLREIDEPQLIADAIKILADELEHTLTGRRSRGLAGKDGGLSADDTVRERIRGARSDLPVVRSLGQGGQATGQADQGA